MRRPLLNSLIIAAAIFAAACGSAEPARNSNAELTKKIEEVVANLPSRSLLAEVNARAAEAARKGDRQFWEDHIDPRFVSYAGGVRQGRDEVLASVADLKCEIRSHTLSEEKMIPLGNDAVILTAKSAFDGDCAGKELPKTAVVGSLYVRSGSDWKLVYRNKIAPDARGWPASSGTASPIPDDSAKSDLISTATRLFDALKKKDIETAGGLATADLSVVSPKGGLTVGLSAVRDQWNSPDCSISRYDITEPKATEITPDIGILTFRANASGRCFGEALEPVWATAIFQKDAEKWQLAYLFQTPIGQPGFPLLP